MTVLAFAVTGGTAGAEVREACAAAAGIVSAVAYLPLWAGVLNGDRLPWVSWLSWAIEQGAVFAAALARHAAGLLAVTGAGAFCCTATFTLILARRQASGGTEPARVLVIAGVIAVMAAWWRTSDPGLAFGLLLAVEGTAALFAAADARAHADDTSLCYWLLLLIAAALTFPGLGLHAAGLSYAYALVLGGQSLLILACKVSGTPRETRFSLRPYQESLR